MPSAESTPPRDVLDCMIRNSLRHPEHLRTFLEDAVPALAANFDCARGAITFAGMIY
jgi:hypothetical protein